MTAKGQPVFVMRSPGSAWDGRVHTRLEWLRLLEDDAIAQGQAATAGDGMRRWAAYRKSGAIVETVGIPAAQYIEDFKRAHPDEWAAAVARNEASPRARRGSPPA